MSTRDELLAAIRGALEPLAYVQALYEGGAAAFGRLDELSDLDLIAVADESRIDDAFAAVEAALQRFGPLDMYWDVPQPAWHGMRQRFYHVAGTPRFLYVDLCVQATDKPHSLTAREQHGEPLVHFDRLGVVASTTLDREAHDAAMRARLESLRASLPMLLELARKEVLRGNPVDAAGLYHAMGVRPLVELLRMRYCPERYTFGLRYVRLDLPAEANARLEALCYPTGMDALPALLDEIEAWAEELLAAL